MTQLTLIRHGETDYNAEGRLQGGIDVPLNARGVAQAHQAGARLTGYGIQVILSSPLQRAYQTATIISQYLHLPVETMPEFAERNLGVFEGLTGAEIQSRYPALWAANVGLQMFASPPGGESLYEFSRRVDRGLRLIRQRYPEQHVLLVAHGFVGRVINGLLRRLTDERFYDFLLRNGEVAEYQL